jgi:hypothetical protein
MAHCGLMRQIKNKSVYDYPQRSVVQPLTYTNLAVTTTQLHTVVQLMLTDRTKNVSYRICRFVCDLLKCIIGDTTVICYRCQVES